MLREEVEGHRPQFFDVESWRVMTDARAGEHALSEATVKLVAGGRRVVATGEGNGPVNALDHALRQALSGAYPELERLQLIDYRVRILDSAHGSDAATRVLIETSDGATSWETVGVAGNIVEASWEALVDGIAARLHRQGLQPDRREARAQRLGGAGRGRPPHWGTAFGPGHPGAGRRSALP